MFCVCEVYFSYTQLFFRKGAGALGQWLKKTTCLKSRRSLKFQRNKMFLPCLLVKIQYCGEPSWARCSELGLRPTGFEFHILCLEGSVTSFIPPTQFSLYVHTGGLKTLLISFHFLERDVVQWLELESLPMTLPAVWFSKPTWCRIFRKIPCLSPLNSGTLFRCCVFGQGTLPAHASLDSGVSEYLVGQRWQCVR